MQPVLVFCALLLLALRIGRWFWKRRKVGKSKAVMAAESAYRAGDYATGLQKAQALENNHAVCGLFRGAFLHQLGKLDEAAEVLEKSMAQQSESKAAALHRETLGLTLMELERFDEALRCFDQAVNDVPERGTPHRAIAEVMLRQGRHSEALRRAKIAVEKNRSLLEMRSKAALPDEEFRSQLSEALGTLAWATASALNDRILVDQLAKEAIPLAAVSVPAQAKVHFDLGCAYAALGEAQKSAHYFQEAARADAHGHWGRMGKRLEQITTESGTQ